MKNFFKKLLLFFTPEKYSEVYFIKGTWNIKYANTDTHFEQFCAFTILKSNKNRYKIKTFGYNPKDHSLYPEVFKIYRNLVEGKYEVSGGEIFKKFEYMTLDECNDRLKKAIESENYELADKIQKIIDNKRK